MSVSDYVNIGSARASSAQGSDLDRLIAQGYLPAQPPKHSVDGSSISVAGASLCFHTSLEGSLNETSVDGSSVHESLQCDSAVDLDARALSDLSDYTSSMTMRSGKSAGIRTTYYSHSDDDANYRRTLGFWLSIQLVASALVSFVNKVTFEVWNFPLTSSVIQLAVVAMILFLPSLWFVVDKVDPLIPDRNSIWQRLSEQFHFAFVRDFHEKMKLLLIPSVMFAGVIGMTNVGISLTSVDIHVLLKCWSLTLFVLLSYLMSDAHNRPSNHLSMAVLLLSLGLALYSWNTFSTGGITLQALAINVGSAVLSPFNAVLLKRATNRLLLSHSDGRPRMTVMQLTVFKLTLAAMLLTPFMFALEGGRAWNQLLNPKQGQYKAGCKLGLVFGLGVLITGVFQSTSIGLTNVLTPALFGVFRQSMPLIEYGLSVLLSDVQLTGLCGCKASHKHDTGRHCDSGDVEFPQCPCFDHPRTELGFDTPTRVLHTCSLSLILFALLWVVTLKFRGMHVRDQ